MLNKLREDFDEFAAAHEWSNDLIMHARDADRGEEHRAHSAGGGVRK